MVGCCKCTYTRCGLCKYIDNTDLLISYSTYKSYRMTLFFNCQATYVVYLIACQECMVQYVGCTLRTLRRRISENIYNIQKVGKRCTLGASKHFIEIHIGRVENVCVVALEQVGMPLGGGHMVYRSARQRGLMDSHFRYQISGQN